MRPSFSPQVVFSRWNNVFAFAILLLCALLASLVQSDVAAQDKNSAKETFQDSSFPWYDKESDSIRKLTLSPKSTDDYAPPDRNRSTIRIRPTVPTVTVNAPSGGWGLGPFFNWMGIALLVAVCAALIWVIGTRFLGQEVRESKATKVVQAVRKADQVEKLPLNLLITEPGGDFLTMARKFMQASEFSKAIVYLYAHELLSLDEQHLIRLAKGKTNRQYLRELRPQPSLQRLVEDTVLLFEDAFFGKKSISEGQFMVCWNQLSQFDALAKSAQRPEVA
ncbi:MAG: DUF4129 domain-containing protein [Planctomycetaceae bacterium]